MLCLPDKWSGHPFRPEKQTHPGIEKRKAEKMFSCFHAEVSMKQGSKSRWAGGNKTQYGHKLETILLDSVTHFRNHTCKGLQPFDILPRDQLLNLVMITWKEIIITGETFDKIVLGPNQGVDQSGDHIIGRQSATGLLSDCLYHMWVNIVTCVNNMVRKLVVVISF